MEEFDEDMKQAELPKVEELSLNGQSGGQEGGAQQETIPKTFVYCEVVSVRSSGEGVVGGQDTQSRW